MQESYIPWTKANKRSWKDDLCRLKPLLACFGKKRLGEISPFQIEQYKGQRKNTPVVSKYKQKARAIGSVNRELRLLSRIFKLAIANNEIRENPCQKVGVIKGEQKRFAALPIRVIQWWREVFDGGAKRIEFVERVTGRQTPAKPCHIDPGNAPAYGSACDKHRP